MCKATVAVNRLEIPMIGDVWSYNAFNIKDICHLSHWKRRNNTQAKKRTRGLQTRWPNRHQHRNNKGKDFARTNNANSNGVQLKMKNMLDYRSDPFVNILNLSNHSCSLNSHKLLIRNLTFVPKPKQYSQKQLDTETDNVLRLLKLRAHFKDVNEIQKSDQLYQPFKVKNKTKLSPKETQSHPWNFHRSSSAWHKRNKNKKGKKS